MKRTKRLISVLVSLAMILVMMAVPAFAAGSATVTVGSAAEEVAPGDTVSLPVTIENNPGFTNYEWNFVYDTTRLTLDSIEADPSVVVNANKNGQGYAACAYATAQMGDETLLTLHFTVKDNAPSGTVEVKIESDNFNNGSSGEDIAVEASYVAGTVKVVGTGGSTTGGSTTGGSTTGGSTTGGSTTTPGTGEEVPPVDATPDDNLGGAVIATPLDKVVDAIPFTDDEKALIDSGAVVTIKLVVSDISDTVSAAEQALIEAALDGQTVGMYMDVKLMKRVGTADFSPVTNLSSDIAIKMTLPKELLTADDTMTRTYSVLRIHDGKVEAVATEFDAKTGALTFETDRFSTYAVVYKDVPVEIEVPSTGDTSNIAVWAGLMVLAAGAAAAVVIYKKKAA